MKNFSTLLLLLVAQVILAQSFEDLVKNGRLESGTDVSWSQFGPGNAGFSNFLRYHPTKPDVCMTSPDLFDVYQTENNGTSWATVKDVDGDGRFQRLRDLYYSSRPGSDFAIAIEQSRLYSSQDMGRNWSTVLNCPWYDGTPEDNRSFISKISALGLDPANDNTWYVGAGNFARGQQVFSPFQRATADDPRGADSEITGVIYKTTNGGASWTTLSTGLNPRAQFNRIIVHPTNSSIVFASSNYGLYRSDNGGTSWTDIGDGKLDNNTILDMDFYYDAATSQFVLYVVDQVRYYPDGQSTRNDGGIFRSFDNGETWTNVNGNLGLDINRLTGGVPTSYYRYIAEWFGISEGAARSTYPVLPTDATQYFNSINVDPSQENTVYVGHYRPELAESFTPGRLWKTSDGGQSWISVARDFGPGWAADADYWNERGNPVNDNMVTGHQPSTQQFGSNFPVRSLRYCAVNSRGDIMIIYAHHTMLSTDGGVTWNQVDEDRTAAGNIMGRGNSNLPGDALFLDKALGEGIGYFASGEHHLWKTTNDGTNGRQAATYLSGSQETVSALATHPWDVNTVYTLSFRQQFLNRIFRSIDGGTTFENWGKATEATAWMRTNALLIDPVNPDNMYFGVTDVGGSNGGTGNDGPDRDREGGFNISTNAGRSFTTSNAGMPERVWVQDLAFDPRDETRASIFAACPWNQERNINGGLYFSNDRGQNWTEIFVAPLLEGINAIEFDHTGRLYATAGRREFPGLAEGGLFFSDDYGQTWTQIFDGPYVDNLSVSPFDTNVLAITQSVLTENPGVFISLDRGQTWTKNNMGIGNPNLITEIAFDFNDPTTLWVSAFGGGFYRGNFSGGADTRKITLTPGTAAILGEETLQVTPTVSNDIDVSSLLYKSSNPSVATVNEQGLVTGITRGAVKIYATTADGRYSDFVQLTVDVANAPLTGVTLSSDSIELNEGETNTLTATPVPQFADLGNTLVWTTSDPAIATVDENGVVTGLASGIAIITASSGDISASTTVFVVGQNRTRFLNWENIDDFITEGDSIPGFNPGQEVDLRFTYGTEIVNEAVEDFVFITVRVLQVNENGQQVGPNTISSFNQLVNTSAPNTDDVTVSYTIPSTFQDGTPIPLTKDLPAGHSLRIRPLMVANDGTGNSFTAALSDIVLNGVNRSRFLTFENVADFIPAGATVPEVEFGQELSLNVSYGTEIVDGVEEDFSFITVRVLQTDETGGQVNISEFNQLVPNSAPNEDNVTIAYPLPATFQDGTAIPLSRDLPAGNKLELRILMVANDGTNQSFTTYQDELVISPVLNRSRFLDWANEADFIPRGQTEPAFEQGKEVALNVRYATEIVNEVEEDFRFITVRVRQLDANGGQVNISDFNQLVTNEAPNSDTVTINYALPTTFADGTAIPLSRDLPAGHRLNLRILMVASDGTAQSFTGYDDEISIVPPTRTRFLTFSNIADFTPEGETVPEFESGQVANIGINYATEIINEMEEDLRFITIRVRQLDAAGNQVNISAFNQAVTDGAPNADETSVSYTFPTTFQDDTPIPITSELPEGHRLFLRILMVADAADGARSFTGFGDEIVILPPGRTRFLTWANEADFISEGGIEPEVQQEQDISINIDYATQISRGEEEDFRFITVRLRQLDAAGNQVNITAFNQLVFDTAPNADNVTVTYTLPPSFPDGTPIVPTANLPEGHTYRFRILMVADDPSGVRSFTGYGDTIIINPIPVSSVSVSPEAVVLQVQDVQALTTTIEPANAFDQSVTWSSTDEGVVTVDSSGTVTAVGGGEAEVIVTTNDGMFTATTQVQVQAPFVAVMFPGILESENYDLGGNNVGNVDNTPGNSGLVYRTDDVDIVETTDLSGGFNVTDTEAGESLTYTVAVANAGDYYLSFRVASTVNAGSLSLSINDIDITGEVTVANTNGVWETLPILTPVNITEGSQELKVNIIEGGFDINYLELVAVPTACMGVDDYINGTVYQRGDQVLFNGLRYSARHYTTSTPGSNDWELEGYCGAAQPDCFDVPVWNPETTYNQTGFSVTYEGDLYVSKWFASPGLLPGTAAVWEFIGPCSSASIDADVTTDCSSAPEWDNTLVYATASTIITYNGSLYKNQWYASPGLEPGVAPVWQLEGPCNTSTAKTSTVLSAKTSDDETLSSTTITVYPNPFKNNINVIFNGNGQYDKIHVLDIQGRVLMTKPINNIKNGTQVPLNVGFLSQGLYFIRISGEKDVKIMKALKVE